MHLIKFPSIYSEIGCVLNKAPAKWNFRQAKLQKSLVCLPYACTKSYKICRFLTEIFQKNKRWTFLLRHSVSLSCVIAACWGVQLLFRLRPAFLCGVQSYALPDTCSGRPQDAGITQPSSSSQLEQRMITTPMASELWGQGGGHCTPQVQDFTPLYLPSQRCGLCHNFKQTTLTTRLYKVRTNLYTPLPTYENVPTRPHNTATYWHLYWTLVLSF